METKTAITHILASVAGIFWYGMTYGQDSGQILVQERWETGNKHIYAYVSLPDCTWEEALNDLNGLLTGFHLATITSQEEHDFLISLLDEVPSFSQGWLGGYQEPPEEPDPAAGWTWVTGEMWSYTNWYFGEPNDGGGCLCENHLTIDFHRGWNDEGTAITTVSGYFAESFEPLFWDGFEDRR